MRAKSSNNATTELRDLKAAVSSTEISGPGRIFLLILNFIPLLHVVSAVLLLAWSRLPWMERIAASILFLYLVPPLMARLILIFAGKPQGRLAAGSSKFFVWWALFQWQIVFCRFPALEELLRLVPGVYSMWLRLWGARIGRLTYWSPGTLITDRSFLRVGDDVVFGAGVRLNPHVLIKNKLGRTELILEPVQVGDRVMVGGYSLLTAGAEIAAGETTRAFLILPPYSGWENGRRVRAQDVPDHE